jgi:hypothetical protein
MKDYRVGIKPRMEHRLNTDRSTNETNDANTNTTERVERKKDRPRHFSVGYAGTNPERKKPRPDRRTFLPQWQSRPRSAPIRSSGAWSTRRLLPCPKSCINKCLLMPTTKRPSGRKAGGRGASPMRAIFFAPRFVVNTHGSLLGALSFLPYGACATPTTCEGMYGVQRSSAAKALPA